MQKLAQVSRHECGYVTDSPVLRNGDGASYYDVSLRYWVPAHEMEMCGHATIGALWIMDKLGMFPDSRKVSVSTKAGTFEALLPEVKDPKTSTGGNVLVAQPLGSTTALSEAQVQDIAKALGIPTDCIANSARVLNAATARIKTLVPLKSVEALDALRPEQPLVRQVCEVIGSTGLYPYAEVSDDNKATTFSARQFPKSSGYLEDPATGIAASALACGLVSNGLEPVDDRIHIRQGWAMGNPSEIQAVVRKSEAGEVTGFWITGRVESLEVEDAVSQELAGMA
jgi:PhzF family phenazine biosynthesis protein